MVPRIPVKEIMMRTLLAAVFLCAISSGASAQIMEMNGTWKLNPERTLGPAPKVETLVYTIKPGEQAYTMDSIEADGKKEHVEWKARYDGKDQPTAGEPGVTVALQKLDRNTELVTNKRNGKVTSTYKRVLVDDSRTIMSIGRDANNKVIWVRVFEKQ
jgi:hypothetical protein